jgi:ubiquinone/menaquinone biosynthesis C-methylase UbiE
MSSAWTAEQIRDFWVEQARQHGTAAAASWSDVRVMEMEVRVITSHLADGDRVLDVGCANGYSTLQFAQARAIDVTGIDYIEGMIAAARRNLEELRPSLRGQARFAVGNALHLDFPDNEFDKVIVIRVIINLGPWEEQLKGLRECIRVLRPGGTLLLSEAALQGWMRLNALRGEWGLEPIPMPSFNNYLDEERVREALAGSCDRLAVRDFASTYYVGTRLLKPLLARLAGRPEQVANPLCELNRWLSLLPAAGDYGTQKLFVFHKASDAS